MENADMISEAMACMWAAAFTWCSQTAWTLKYHGRQCTRSRKGHNRHDPPGTPNIPRTDYQHSSFIHIRIGVVFPKTLRMILQWSCIQLAYDPAVSTVKLWVWHQTPACLDPQALQTSHKPPLKNLHFSVGFVPLTSHGNGTGCPVSGQVGIDSLYHVVRWHDSKVDTYFKTTFVVSS